MRYPVDSDLSAVDSVLKVTSNGLRQQLRIHLRIKVSRIYNNLLTVLLCTTLKPDGK